MKKPWANEFPVDGPEGMDEAAVRILVENHERGREPRCVSCQVNLALCGSTYCGPCTADRNASP